MKPANSVNELYRQLMVRKVAFFVAFFVIVLLSYTVLYIIDFIPEPVTQTQEESEVDTESTKTEDVSDVQEVVKIVNSPVPLKIVFDSLDKEVTILNPASREVADLDEALLFGAVRHPDSADFTDDGNIFILGHSSYLPNVFNKSFQAFNGIQDLTWGDKIRLQSEDTEYVYRVDSVYKAKATEVVVPETPGEAKLTLATCNSFGSKDDRFMVEATLIEEHSL